MKTGNKQEKLSNGVSNMNMTEQDIVTETGSLATFDTVIKTSSVRRK